jgi:quercetin dioxygenase-like cupin family protein
MGLRSFLMVEVYGQPRLRCSEWPRDGRVECATLAGSSLPTMHTMLEWLATKPKTQLAMLVFEYIQGAYLTWQTAPKPRHSGALF